MLRRQLRILVAAAVMAVSIVAVIPPTVSAEPSTDSFYQPPAPLPAVPHGTLLRSRPVTPLLVPLVPMATRAWQIMYTSTGTDGAPIAVTGTVIVPNSPWTSGPRPVIAWAAGTQGVADKCAPSYQYQTGSEYEAPFSNLVLGRGWSLVITDYQGLGTPGDHAYLIGKSAGTAMLDAVLAAQQLAGSQVQPGSPVGIMGYSQGGQAAAFAAELEASYAPSLDVRGTAVGGAPARIDAALATLDGGPFSALVPYAMVGYSATYPELDVTSQLTAAGQAAVASARSKCLYEMIASHPRLQSSTLTTGTPVLQRPDWQARLHENRTGQGMPTAPALIYHGVLDVAIPYTHAQQLLADWCGNGGQVELLPVVTAEHFLGFWLGHPLALGWMADRFGAAAAGSSC